MNSLLSNATVRLLECLVSETDAKVLGRQLMREVLYRVLRGEGGCALMDLLLVNESRTQIHRLLQRMHRTYASPLNVSSLAHEIGMSVSGLHLHFKAITGTSPVQYLKTVRLYKARMLMVQQSIGASIAAERVGYESPSQFSREFKRLFGTPPVDEAQRVRTAFGFTDQVSAASS
jgi:transcriptional regulator GlxA family with amidase domain